MGSDDVLHGHELFRSLNVEEAHRLSAFSHAKTCEAGQTVFECDRPANHIFMLLRGSVSLKLPAAPSEFGIVVSKVGPGEIFGLSPLLDSPRYTTTAECTEPSEVLAIDAGPFRKLLHENCPVALDVLNRTARIYFTRYLEVLRNLQAVVNQIHLVR
jgi:CRP-like cAMP-binding protein